MLKDNQNSTRDRRCRYEKPGKSHSVGEADPVMIDKKLGADKRPVESEQIGEQTKKIPNDKQKREDNERRRLEPNRAERAQTPNKYRNQGLLTSAMSS